VKDKIIDRVEERLGIIEEKIDIIEVLLEKTWDIVVSGKKIENGNNSEGQNER